MPMNGFYQRPASFHWKASWKTKGKAILDTQTELDTLQNKKIRSCLD